MLLTWQLDGTQALLLAGVAVLLIACLIAAERVRRMHWRMRWLMLVTAVFFFFGTPGEHVQMELIEPLGLSYDGIAAGLQQLLRLSMFTSLLAILLECLSREALVSALHAAMTPLAWLGFDHDRVALRLTLVLQLLELPEQSWRNWISPQMMSTPESSCAIPLLSSAWSCWDGFALLGAGLLLVYVI